MPKILTREQQLAAIARKQRHILAVYFATGILLPLPRSHHLQVSTTTITSRTLFVSQQKGQ